MCVKHLDVYLIIFAAMLVACVLVFAGTALTSRLSRRRPIAGTVLISLIYVALLVTRPENWLVSTGVVLGTAIFAGTAIGRTAKSDSALIAMCVAVAVVDIVSFSFGLTHLMLASYMSGRSQLLVYFCFSVPIRSIIAPLVGIGDLLILGAMFCGLRNLRYSAIETFVVPVTGLLIALVVGLLVNSIYALPFVAATVVIYILIRRERAGYVEYSAFTRT